MDSAGTLTDAPLGRNTPRREADFWSNFAVRPPATSLFKTTQETTAEVWDSYAASGLTTCKRSDDVLATVNRAYARMTSNTVGSERNRQFLLVSSVGCPSRADDPIQLSANAFIRLTDVIGLTREYYPFYFTRLFHCSYHFEYRDALTDHPTELVVFLRCPRNSQSIICLMRVRLSDLSCVALVYGSDHESVKRITALCTEEDGRRLRMHPFYLLSCIYELRYESWTRWFSSLWSRVNDIETATKMTGETWQSRDVPPDRLDALKNTETLLTYMHSAHTEFCHGENVVSFAIKLGKFCLDVVDVLETTRASQGHVPTSQRERAGLEATIKFTAARCDAVRDRLLEMKQRLQGQINVSFSLIAQKDSKLAKQDNETMKAIAALGLLFLPATLVTAIWSAGLFHLDEGTNWKVYVGTAIALTVLVFFSWGLYMRRSRRAHTVSNRSASPV
ncbi:hypothetical protein CONLIGDRAFT_711163 [Coniochaeta ligniaria NRRL 30616]|uniref:Cora-domain-containing protein n=1 Tax=Coniochaeta ligniaria NRRL 30616 TaxID=1408157 RepID=A0A1J7IZP3_9PEZI|nr:hypothetical protein CONLIGDRAFT_711163 [Coniochaeta ligniaria NRRL 30616]